MTDIKSITQELSISSSIVPDTKDVLENNTKNINEEQWHETVRFLHKKIDELVSEVNNLKNS